MYINSYRYNNRFPPTAESLANLLGWDLVSITYPNNGDIVVNWGRNMEDNPNAHILNVHAPKDKATAFQELQDATVSVPPFILGSYITRALRHRGGNDIREYSGRRRFVVKAIDKVKEYRIEVFQGNAFRGHIKYPPSQPIFNWNRDNSEWETHGYRTMREAVGDSVITEAKKAVSALGYDFGAVDLITDAEGQVYVLEVNSAPAINEAGLGKYRYRINRWVESV